MLYIYTKKSYQIELVGGVVVCCLCFSKKLGGSIYVSPSAMLYTELH